jgi:hypothetical protein
MDENIGLVGVVCAIEGKLHLDEWVVMWILNNKLTCLFTSKIWEPMVAAKIVGNSLSRLKRARAWLILTCPLCALTSTNNIQIAWSAQQS